MTPLAALQRGGRAMNAEKWDQLRWLDYAYEYLEPHRYDRKLRLFAVACYRESRFHISDERAQRVIDLSEAFADDLQKHAELVEAAGKIQTGQWDNPHRLVIDAVAVPSASYIDSARKYRHGVQQLIDLRTRMKGPFDRWILETEAKWHEQFAFLQLLRDIVGNPFRPVAFDSRWRSEAAVALASAIYAERAFDRMPILADALEEAGCDHPDVLTHCRDPHQLHARGCWVVDLVLNKS
jgi:hypothetical protein